MVIDDDPSIIEAYRLILSSSENEIQQLERKAAALEAELFGEEPSDTKNRREYYDLRTASQGEEGFHMIKKARAEKAPFAVVFLDIRMPPGWDGVQTAKMIRRCDPDIEIVLVTAYSDRKQSDINQWIRPPEKLLYIKKPFDHEEIRQLAMSLTRKWDLEQKSRKQRHYLKQTLDSVKRLKTLNISSVKAVFSAILIEILNFTDAKKGFVASWAGDKVKIEINPFDLPQTEIDGMIEGSFKNSKDINAVSWTDSAMVFPLSDGHDRYFVLVSDANPPFPHDQDKVKLIGLMLEVSNEVLENAGKQERFLKTEKIATIGQIAAGIIHEVNNPLTALIGAAEIYKLYSDRILYYLDSCQQTLKKSASGAITRKMAEIHGDTLEICAIRSRMIEHYTVIHDGVGRIRSIMENVRGISKENRKSVVEYRDLADAVEKTILLTHNTVKDGVIIYKELERPLMAWCDITALKQVLLNLILNAVRAMNGKGKLWIHGKKNNSKICISVRDSGPGMSDDIKDRIFDPFYSAKDTGPGLGLSIAKGVIERHHGTLQIESCEGKGTTFFIELPAAEKKRNTTKIP